MQGSPLEAPKPACNDRVAGSREKGDAMTRLRLVGVAVLLVLATAAFAAATPASRSDGDGNGRRHIAMRDDCDPRDAAWNAVGGCTLKRGDVSFAEFNGELDSPLSTAVIGHQAWRTDPS